MEDKVLSTVFKYFAYSGEKHRKRIDLKYVKSQYQMYPYCHDKFMGKSPHFRFNIHDLYCLEMFGVYPNRLINSKENLSMH